MKKILVTIMILGLVLTGVPAEIKGIAAAPLFTDVPDNAWYKKDLEYIANDSRRIMEGYNGKFFPGDTLTVEQFLKTVTVAAGFVAEPVQPPIKWSFPYIEKAYSMKLIQSGEFTDYERGITRAEMARIIIRALPSITGETKVAYDLNTIKARMSDYNTIPENLRDFVCQAYQLGILTGGTDGKFNPNKTLVRAEAAAVLHRLVDKSARVTQPTSNDTKDMWTDAEFEAFMRSAEVKNYVNTNAIVKVENGRIYFKDVDNGNKPVLISEDADTQGINDFVYKLYKIMAYHTKKTDGYMMGYYVIEDKYVRLMFYVNKNDHRYIRSGAIDLTIYLEPTKSITAEKHFPGKQKGHTYYIWILGGLHDDEDLAGYKLGMDRRQFEWTQPRYEKIFRDLCVEVYGEQQGMAFYNFALTELDNRFYTGTDYKASYISFNKDVGAEIVYYVPEENVPSRFSTDKPAIKK